MTRTFSKIRIVVTAAASAIILSGCSISPAVDAVSLTVDGVSYFFTGKGMFDHTLSAAADKDCAWSRVVKGERYCVPNNDDVIGDRMVFTLDESPWSENSTTFGEIGDPLTVDATVADITESLGGAVRSGYRSTAIAAVAADNLPVPTAEPEEGFFARTGGLFSGLIKEKTTSEIAAPDRATRLWLPVDEAEYSNEASLVR